MSTDATYRYLTRCPGIRSGNTIVVNTRIGVHDVVGLVVNGKAFLLRQYRSDLQFNFLQGVTKYAVGQFHCHSAEDVYKRFGLCLNIQYFQGLFHVTRSAFKRQPMLLS